MESEGCPSSDQSRGIPFRPRTGQVVDKDVVTPSAYHSEPGFLLRRQVGGHVDRLRPLGTVDGRAAPV